MSTNTHSSHKLTGNQLGSKSNHSAASSSSASATTQSHHPPSSLHLLQQHKAPQHTVPPRYQPPPQPPGGILKNGFHHSPVSTDASGVPLHLNIKYPPDVPKLATVYIPDALRGTIPSASNQPKGSLAQRQLHQRHSTGQPIGHRQTTSTDDAGGHHHPLHRIGAQHPQSQVQQQQQPPQPPHQSHSSNGQSNHHQIALQQQHHHDMLKFVRKPDADPTVVSGNGGASSATAVVNGSSMIHQNNNNHIHSTNNNNNNGSSIINQHSSSHSNNITNNNNNAARISADQSRHLQQSMLAELRTLKEANQRLSDDNQELRDLCCFLDDDRQKGRKLAREWQRFGRYTASVMRQEVSAYQNKLRQLDDKQQELIRDNLELKELCLYLDEERANVAGNVSVCTNCGSSVRPTMRDDGDGSSSSTNADEPMPSVRQFERPIPELNIRPTLSDQTLQYVRSLERKIRQLEQQETHSGSATASSVGLTAADPTTVGRPEAVVRALQILEVREQLERDRSTAISGMVAGSGSGGGGVGGGADVNGIVGAGIGSLSTEHMDDGEKALVREMCNVVWRKLEDSPNGPGLDPM